MTTSGMYVIKGEARQYEFVIATAADGTKGWLRGALNSNGEWIYTASADIAGKALTAAYTLEHTEQVLAATSSASTRLNAVRTEFNSSALLADFADVKAAAAIVGAINLVDFLDLKEVNLPNIPDYTSTLPFANEGPFVTYNGKISSTGSTTDRQYFIAAHDGKIPGGWAAFDQIGGNQIDLGSWYFDRQVLAKIDVTLTDISPPTVTLSSPTSSVDEGGTVNFSLATTNINPGTIIPYSITGVSAADIGGGLTQGSFTIGADGKASVTIQLVEDKLTEGAETLTLSVSGRSANVIINDKSINPIPYTLSAAASKINEGATNNLYIKTTAPVGTVVPYKITGVSPDRISASTLYGPVTKTATSVEGNLTINAFGQATLPITLINNYAVDGASALTVTLGDSLATASFIVNDTSLPEPLKRYALSPVSATVAPGSTASFTLATENVAAGTQLNYSISGVPASYIANGLLSGNVTIKSDGKAVIDVPLNAGLNVSDVSNQIKLSVLPSTYTPDTITISGSGTLTGTPINAQNYAFVYIDAAKFSAGGTVNLSISLGSGTNASSYDLFKASTPVIISGRPIDSLANAYDVSPNSVRTLTYKFGPGSESVFKLGIEGNWSAVAGTNTYTYTGTVVPNPIAPSAEPLAVSSVTIAPPTYRIAAVAPSYDEGSSALFTVTTTGVATGATLPYSLSGIAPADIANGLLNGTTTVGGDGKATISVPIAADKVTDGAETMTVTLENASASVLINDTSRAVGTYTLISTSPSVEEGSNATFTLTTQNVPQGTSVSYTITGLSAADIVEGVVAGAVMVDANGTATITVPVAADNLTESTETLTVTANGKSASTLVVDTSKELSASYTITPGASAVDEGKLATFTVQGTNVKSGASAAYRLSGLNAEDITGGQVNGKVIFDELGLGTISVPIAADSNTEGTESLTVTIGGASSTITVNDTSKSASQYYLSASDGIVEEGRIATFTVSAADVVPGSRLAYTISGDGITSRDITNGKLSGSVSIGTDNSATITVPLAADKTTEGDESLTVSLTGLGVSETITIDDTSGAAVVTATYEISAVASSIREGEEAEFLLETDPSQAGKSFKWAITGVSTTDLAGKKLSGTAVIGSDGTATISVPTATDTLAEGNETLTLTVNGVKASLALLDDTSIKVADTVTEGVDRAIYKTTLGSYVLATPGLASGDALEDYVPLMASATKPYLPKSVTAILSYEDGTYGLISSAGAGTGSKLSYSEQLFSEDGIAKGKAVRLKAAQVLAKEVVAQIDLNGDGQIGDVIRLVLDGDGDANQQEYGLYTTSSGAVVLGDAGQSEGDAAGNSVTLMASKIKGWVVPAGAGVTGIAITDGGSLEVLTLKGRQYSAQKFDAETGIARGKPAILKTTQIDAREYYYNLDLTGDDDISLVGQESPPSDWAV